ncbi:gst-9 [Pristionchus pacificus]|uniref:glutathione transferase n=1 Tax=Pristionchus pacificus TaxID=54126 RepID=A0A454XMS6_PRIPA|nr:gst-9 [Pristionchus pacificus]|eukprot:PDM72410.1 gst-9 [Pristionchus pacificus]
MPFYKLSYFNGRALGEVSRQLFHLSGTPFEDERVTAKEWDDLKGTTPFGQLPVLYVDGKPLPQSFAIARYLAKEFGYAGKTAFEEAWADALADQFKDYLNEMKPFMMLVYGFGDGDKDQMKKDIALPAINKLFTILEKAAKDNGSNGHFVGDSLTWVDLLISDHIGILEAIVSNPIDSFPLVQEIRRKTSTHPKVKKWIDKRPATTF